MFENRVALVTGATRGIGKAIASKLASEGANIVIFDVFPEESVTETVSDLQALGAKVAYYRTDITDSAVVETNVKAAIEEMGKIDILVNNAGVLDTGLKAVDKYLDDELPKIIAINQIGTMQCIKAALSALGEGGSIVNVASVAGINGGGGAAYVSTKAAIVGITKHTALLLADKKIRCNAVCPGSIATPMTAGMKPENMDMAMFGVMRKHNDLSVGVCMPEDVANILLFLASDESRAITGQAIVSDFGSSL